MKRSGKIALQSLIIAAALAGIVTQAAGPGKVVAQVGVVPGPTEAPRPKASSSGPIPFHPITVADFGPVSTNADYPAWLDMSGDWVGYAAKSVVCRHCGLYTHTIYAQNLITGKKVKIQSSSQHGYTVSEFRTGATELHFSGTLITWQQPTRPSGATPGPGTPVTPLEDFVRGTYECGACYYDLSTGQGGALTNAGATPTATPHADWNISINNQRNTITVTSKSTGKLALQATLGDYWSIGDPVIVAPDKIAFFQSKGVEDSPQLLQVQPLTASDPSFDKVWAKADQPVAAGKAARSWLWGPAPILTTKEAYTEGVGGQRVVQYYDKSRMEINNPNADPNSPGYITNGLLTVEMIGGEIQLGDATTITTSVPCVIPVAGDPRKDNPLTPDYSTLVGVATIHGDHMAQPRTGQKVDDSIDVTGTVGKDTAHGNAAHYVSFVTQTGHNIPDIFQKYLTGMQGTYGFDWTFVLGYPITEAYWTTMRVSGKDMPVLIQAYQRRVLTYVPDFPAQWQVQQGNVGQHYLEWRTANFENDLLKLNIAP